LIASFSRSFSDIFSTKFQRKSSYKENLKAYYVESSYGNVNIDYVLLENEY